MGMFTKYGYVYGIVPDVECLEAVTGRSNEVKTTVYSGVRNLFSSHHTPFFRQKLVKLLVYLIVDRQPAAMFVCDVVEIVI